MVKQYELVLLIDPQVGESQVETTIEAYKERLEAANAEVAHVDKWGLRKLAYTSAALHGRKQAYYALYQFSGPPELIQSLETVMKLDEAVLRFLFTTVEGDFVRVPQLAPENVYIYNPPERPGYRRGPRRDRDGESGDRGDRGGSRGDRGGPRDGNDGERSAGANAAVSDAVTETATVVAESSDGSNN